MRFVVLFAVVLLGGCGASRGVTPAEGQALPVAPYGATETPTPAELLTPSTQARPSRNDELLRQSERRRADEFDLPPTN